MVAPSLMNAITLFDTSAPIDCEQRNTIMHTNGTTASQWSPFHSTDSVRRKGSIRTEPMQGIPHCH
jgi:hypothetical protein